MTRTAVIAAAVLACILSAALAYVASVHKLPWSDEGWFSSASYNLAKHGFMGTTVLEPAGTRLTRIEQRTYWVLPIYLLAEAAWYAVAPAGIVSTRVFTILWSMLGLAAFGVFVQRLFRDPRVTALGVAILALNYIWIDNAAFGRPDIMCAAFGIGGMAAYLALRPRSINAALAAGNALVAASGLTHPNGILHFVGLWILVLLYDRRHLNWKALASAAAPYLIMGALWSVYILQDPAAFRDQMLENGTNSRVARTLNPVAILWNELRDRYLVVFGLLRGGITMLKGFALFTFAVAIAGLLSIRTLRRNPDVRALLVLILAYFAIQSVFNQKLSYYLVHIVPLYVAATACFAVYLWDRLPSWRLAVAGWIALLMLLETGGIMMRARQRSYVGPQREAIEFVRSKAAPAKRIMGTAALLYEMKYDPRLLDDPYIGLRSGKIPDVIIVESLYSDLYSAWAKERPEDSARIQQRLSSYHLAYNREGYKVYLRPALAR